jgi:putative DNA primase/helicase
MNRRLAPLPKLPASEPAADAEVVAVVSTIDGEWGAEIRWLDPAKRERRAIVWAEEASHKRRWEDATSRLAGLGLRIRDAKAMRDWLLAAIQGHSPDIRVLASTRLGWHQIDGRRAFVLPHASLGGDIRYVGDYVAVEACGTLEDWQQAVAAKAEQAWPAVVAIMASLSVPMIGLLSELHPAGIHLWGDSSTDKTTALRAAASCWGSWRLIRSWRAAIHGLEAVAEMLNDLPLILDEASEVDPKVLEASIYMLAYGQGKTRARRTGEAADIRRWRTAPISSGERPTAEILQASLGRQMMGLAARMVDIQVRADDYGSAEQARELSIATDTCHGTAGPAFIEAILELGREELLAKHEQTHRECIEIAQGKAKRDLAPVEARALRGMARLMLAGQIGVAAGILPWHELTPRRAVSIAIERWLGTRDRPATEHEHICARIRAWVGQHMDRLCDLDSDIVPRKPIGWCRRRRCGDEVETTVYLSGETLALASGGFPPQRAAAALAKRGWLIKGSTRAQQAIRVPQGGTRWVYALRIDEA